MKSQIINTGTKSINPDVDVFVMFDHMPEVIMNPSSGHSLDECRIKYFGKNTIVDLFTNQGLDYTNHFFILDYVGLDNFDQCSFFYPTFLLSTVIDYHQFSPDHKIDFAQKKYSTNCAMNKSRPARLIASCWFRNNNIDGLQYTQSWDADDSSLTQQLDDLLQMGNLIDYTHEHGPATIMLARNWVDHQGNTPDNYDFNNPNEENFFNSQLRLKFDTTAISVVLEPVFWENGCNITEKYVQALYGGTIPLVNGYCVYDKLNVLGFDTFSDIIDTSSQYELDPVLRIWNMLEKNKNVFEQWQHLISDPQIQTRIVNNLNLLKTPTVLFNNMLKLNSSDSLQQAVFLKDVLDRYNFIYSNMLKTNK